MYLSIDEGKRCDASPNPHELVRLIFNSEKVCLLPFAYVGEIHVLACMQDRDLCGQFFQASYCISYIHSVSDDRL